MINKFALHRSRKQFEDTTILLDTTAKEQPAKSSFTLIPEPNHRLFVPKGYSYSSPLLSHYNLYPKQIQNMLHSSVHRPVVGYKDEMFWMAAGNKLCTWTYPQGQASLGLESQSESTLTSSQFPHNILAVNYLKSPVISFIQKRVVGIFVVAFTNSIQLFVLEKGSLVSLNIRISTGQAVQQITGDSKGNIYYIGDSGVAKQIQNRTQTTNKFKNVNGMNFLHRMIHNYSFGKVEIKVKRIVINEQKNRLHCLVVKTRSAPRFFSSLKKGEEDVEIETYVLNPLSYHHKFSNNQFYEELISTNGHLVQISRENLRIVDIFIAPENLLGLVLFSGAFIKLLNTRIMTIGAIEYFPLAPVNNTLLEKIFVPQTSYQYSVISSEGESHISQLQFQVLAQNELEEPEIESRRMTAFIGPGVLDYCNEFESETLGIFQRKRLGLKKYLEGTIFSSNKEYISFLRTGMVSYQKLDPLNLLLAILNIHYESSIEHRLTPQYSPLLQTYIQIYSLPTMCTYLIQIICARHLSVSIPSSYIQNTKHQYYKLPPQQTIGHQRGKRVYENSSQIRKLAGEIIYIYECQEISNDVPKNVYEKNLKEILNEKVDILWSAISSYFNEVFKLVKHVSIRVILNQKSLIYYIKEKLNIFDRFLRKKLDDKVNIVHKYYKQPTKFINLLPSEDIGYLRPKVNPSKIHENLTSNLIIRLIQNIKQISAIINAFEISEGEYSEDITVGGILLEQETRNKFAKIFFKNIGRDHPSALQLVNVMPEFICYLNKPNQEEFVKLEAYVNQPFKELQNKYQILNDIRSILNNYHLAEKEEEREARQRNNRFEDVFEKRERVGMREIVEDNSKHIKKDQEVFESILLKIIHNVQIYKVDEFRSLLKQILIEIRRSGIPVYLQLASALLSSYGLEDYKNVLSGGYEEKEPHDIGVIGREKEGEYQKSIFRM